MNENFAKVWVLGVSAMMFFACFFGRGWLFGVAAMLILGFVKMM